MAQNRKPPCYQEYAAEMIANFQYRTMSLEERGLMDTMRRECWVNHYLPSTPDVLARVLGFKQEQIEVLLPMVMPFFQLSDSKIICPELEDYRAHLAGIRKAQSEGGKVGASITNDSKKKPRKPVNAGSTGKPASDLQVDPQVKVESVVKSNPVKPSQTLSLETVDIQDWVNGYDNYDNASNGQ